MKYFILILIFPELVFAQFVTDYPEYRESNSTELVIQKVEHSTLKTALSFKFTYKKKGNTNIFGSLLGLNPEKIAVCIRDHSFLVDTLKGKRYELLRAIDIPYCSSGRTFLSYNQSLVFDLFFERLEPGVEVFDFKEGIFYDTTLINRHTWSISGIEAQNPEEGKESRIKSHQKKENTAYLIDNEQPNTFYFVETKAQFLPNSEEKFQKYLSENLENLRNANRILIEGHTDKIGDFEKNRKLSIQRAELIKTFLIANEINEKKIFIKGYSHLKIISLKRDEASKLKNRRAEIKLS